MISHIHHEILGFELGFICFDVSVDHVVFDDGTKKVYQIKRDLVEVEIRNCKIS